MRYPFFLILASIIGYLPYVSGYYVALFSGDDFKLIEGRFINEVVCTEVSEESYCSNKWIIDSSLFSKKYNTLGLGIIIYSVKIGCVDLCEVAHGLHSEWDANVGMRMLYQLCGWLFRSQGEI